MVCPHRGTEEQGHGAGAHHVGALTVFRQQCYAEQTDFSSQKGTVQHGRKRIPQPPWGSRALPESTAITRWWSLPGMAASIRKVPGFADQAVVFTDVCSALEAVPTVTDHYHSLLFFMEMSVSTAWCEIKWGPMPEPGWGCTTSAGNSCPLDWGKTQDK